MRIKRYRLTAADIEMLVVLAAADVYFEGDIPLCADQLAKFTARTSIRIREHLEKKRPFSFERMLRFKWEKMNIEEKENGR